jgi:hypothetical protein
VAWWSNRRPLYLLRVGTADHNMAILGFNGVDQLNELKQMQADPAGVLPVAPTGNRRECGRHGHFALSGYGVVVKTPPAVSASCKHCGP